MLQPDDPILPYATSPCEPITCTPMRAGNYLVVGAEATLPQRCVLCNGAAIDPPVHLRIPIRYNSFELELPDRSFQLRPWGASQPFFTLITPRISVHASYCSRHFRIRSRALSTATIFFALAALAPIIAIALRSVLEPLYLAACLGLCLLFLLAGGIAMVIATRGPRSHHFAGGYHYLNGVGNSFLLSLPEAPSSALLGE